MSVERDPVDFATAFVVPTRTIPTGLSELSTEDAYEVQRRALALRMRSGERAVGYKVGCVSSAIQQQLGLSQPICGRLMYPHVHTGETTLNFNDFVAPAVEPEIAIRMARDVDATSASLEAIADAIDCVSAAVEFHHYAWRTGEPTSQELIASNGIHACVVVGTERVPAKGLDWEGLRFDIYRNGLLCESADGRDIMGSPLHSLEWLVSHLAARGENLRQGDLVIPGSPVKLVRVRPGDEVITRVVGVGEISAKLI